MGDNVQGPFPMHTGPVKRSVPVFLPDRPTNRDTRSVEDLGAYPIAMLEPELTGDNEC